MMSRMITPTILCILYTCSVFLYYFEEVSMHFDLKNKQPHKFFLFCCDSYYIIIIRKGLGKYQFSVQICRAGCIPIPRYRNLHSRVG